MFCFYREQQTPTKLQQIQMALKFKTGRIFSQKFLTCSLQEKIKLKKNLKNKKSKVLFLQQNCARCLRGGNMSEIKTLQTPRKPLHIPKKCCVWCHEMNRDIMSAKSINQTYTTVYQWLGAPFPETQHPMFNLGGVQTAIAIPFSAEKKKKKQNKTSSLRLLMSLPSSSWSKLQGKKSLSICFFLVLLDVFILGSFTSCELRGQVGKVVSLHSFFFYPLN